MKSLLRRSKEYLIHSVVHWGTAKDYWQRNATHTTFLISSEQTFRTVFKRSKSCKIIHLHFLHLGSQYSIVFLSVDTCIDTTSVYRRSG